MVFSSIAYFFIYFIFLILIFYSSITDLQCCSNFFYTAKWPSYTYIHMCMYIIFFPIIYFNDIEIGWLLDLSNFQNKRHSYTFGWRTQGIFSFFKKHSVPRYTVNLDTGKLSISFWKQTGYLFCTQSLPFCGLSQWLSFGHNNSLIIMKAYRVLYIILRYFPNSSVSSVFAYNCGDWGREH